jgi:hypothetical protein
MNSHIAARIGAERACDIQEDVARENARVGRARRRKPRRRIVVRWLSRR